MIDLSRHWPLGLDRRKWTDCASVVVCTLFILVFFDVWLSQALQALPDVWRAPFAFVTHFGLTEWIIVPTAIGLLVSVVAIRIAPAGLWRSAACEFAQLTSFVLLAVGLPGLAVNLLKRLIGRARPLEFHHSGQFEFSALANDWNFQSFPSGHTTTAIAMAFAIGFLAPRYFRLLLLIAVTTGISRVVIGMHYPTDVVAGLIIGTLGAFAVRNYYARRRWLFADQSTNTIQFCGTPNLVQAWQRLFQRARA